jgi:predicted ATP-dependent endonuclease of OLD family
MKIQSITINKYKAFTKEEKIPVGGSNVFIYGENGSGKSSFYYALKDFFQSSVETVKMADLRNFNLSDGGTDCSIKVEFDGEIVKTLNETTKDTNTTEIIYANRLKSFLTYKHLLGVHNVKISDKIDVFDLVVNGVLKHFKSELITNNIELGKLWNGVFSQLGEEWFDEYWVNYGTATMIKDGKSIKISSIWEFLEFKGRVDLFEKVNAKGAKRKKK